MSSAQVLDPDPLDPLDFGFLDQDLKNYADSMIRIQKAKDLDPRGKYRPKRAKKLFIFKLPSNAKMAMPTLQRFPSKSFVWSSKN